MAQSVGLAMQDAAGGTTVVASPGSNGTYAGGTGVIVRRPSGPGGDFDHAIDFNGTDSRISEATAESLAGTFTLGLWLYRDDSSRTEAICGGGANTTRIRFIGASTLEARIGSVNNTITLTNPVTAGAWTHVVLTRDGSNNLTVYINGVAQADVENETGALAVSLIGRNTAGTDHFDGGMADFRIYDTALDQTAIDTWVAEGGTVVPAIVTRCTGAVTSTSACTLWTLDAEADVEVNIYEADDLITPVDTVSAGTTSVIEGRNVIRIDISGLTPNTAYVITPVIDTVENTLATLEFTTFPSGADDFTFCFGSCIFSAATSVFDRIAAHNPRFFLHLGDWGYFDPAANDEDLFHDNYDSQLTSIGSQADFYAAFPIDYTGDDHDTGGDGATSSSTAMPAFCNAYRDRFPHYNLPHASAIYHSFVCGRVRFIVCDNRSQRVTGGGSTAVGATQMAWIKSEITEAKDNNQVFVLVSSFNWIMSGASPYDPSDAWPVAERTEIQDYIVAEGMTDSHIILCGDSHAIQVDDGTNSDDSTTGTCPSPVFHASPLSQSSKRKGGPYSEGVFPDADDVASREQYGKIVVTDNGGSTLNVAFTGYATDDSPQVPFDTDLTVPGVVDSSIATLKGRTSVSIGMGIGM
jgi:hypothetical protein